MATVGKELLVKLLEEHRVADFLKLRREYFYQDEQKTFDFIQKYYDRYGVLPSRDLASKKGELRGVKAPDVLGYYHDEVLKRALYNMFGEVLPEVQEQLTRKEPQAALDLVTNFVEATYEIRSDGQRGLVQMKDLAAVVLAKARDARASAGVTGIPTGWPTLDETTCGLQNGDVYICLARPKMGKSLAMMRMASAAHNEGYAPLFVSMEMGDEQMARRFFTLRTSFNMNKIKKGQISHFGEQVILREAERMESQVPFTFIEGQFRQDIQDVASLVHSVRPDVVFIDGGYLVKMARASKRLARWEIIGDIAQEIKNIAFRNNIPIVVSFQFTRQMPQKQLRRQNTDNPRAKKAGFEHVQLADAIGQLASVGFGLFDDMDEDSASSSRRRFIEVVGGREGEEGGFTINWDWERMNFDELQEEYIPYNVPEE